MTDEHPNPNQWWFHRRLMAYVSLAGIVISLLCALTGAIPSTHTDLVEGLCWVFGFILLGYYGNNAFEAFAQARK
ncbi:hypothetical protein [Marinobacter sp. OP 3.4]|uniref:hypothetical protein n=1 Tax=Marinobacter sp. OP 3.4 TaxID=3076501 RepID=UPI002E20CA1D